ncbi:hypothetical protein COB57_02405 [Candidatus Peregrinibacteria bacterium]|nr:MAG: hypothetical protein COB57_02405 [Candidatus Peregrinibacteria bacterium]
MKTISFFLSSMFLFFGLALAVPAHAEISPSDFSANTTNAGILSNEDKPDFATGTQFKTAIINIINSLLGFLGIVAVALIIYGGVLKIVDPESEKAVEYIKGAVIGLTIILLSYSFIALVIDVAQSA